MLYTITETQKRLLYPYSEGLKNASKLTQDLGYIFPGNWFLRALRAQSEFLYQFGRTYEKPRFDFGSIEVQGVGAVAVEESVVLEKDFCSLVNFKKPISGPALLIVAPLSGHYATLLRETVRSCLPDFNVYITQWKNAADIELDKGDFGFEDYVSYIVEFIEHINSTDNKGPCSVMAVCQPTVPVLTALAYLDKTKSAQTASSVVLMGGPIDVRISPTQVNSYAQEHSLEWFRSHVIEAVPFYFKGAGRLVYPGYLQHMGFVAMNPSKHTQAYLDFFNNLLKGAELEASKHKKFYEEYNAVMDLPAKYYLETLERVFIDQHLAKGTMRYKGEGISLEDLHRPSVISVEGELDDISGSGQTHVVHTLTPNIGSEKKEKITVPGVGHYGVFSGKKWREFTYPKVKEFLLKNTAQP